jgi:hypothetical protein
LLNGVYLEIAIKTKVMKNRICLIIAGILVVNLLASKSSGQEQKPDSVQNMLPQEPEVKNEKKARKNTILINITNPSLISNKFFTVGYERILPNNQSFSVSVGSFSYPQFISGIADSLGIDHNYSDKGLHISADYRFYLKSLNKYDAPRGIYIGPYYAYNHNNRGVDWYLDGKIFNGVVSTDIKLNIHTIGFELGYQFVFWDRLALDMILFGPGFGSYSLNTKISTTLTADQESEFFDKLNEYLENQIPGYDLVIDSGEFKNTGSFNVWELGYRYSIRLGFRF